MSEFTEFQRHDINSAEIANQGWGMAPAGVKDDGKIVGFFYKAVLNRQKSKEQNLPVHDNKICVRIQNPGEKDFIERESNETDKARWPRQWEAFTKGRKYVSDGTPLDMLFPTEPNIVATINQFNIQTVQQLANLSGDAISRGGIGFGNWVEKAKVYIASSKGGADYHKVTAQLAAKDEQISALQKQLSDLSAQVNQMMQRQPTNQTGYAPQGQTIPALYPGIPGPAPTHDFQSEMIANSMAQDFSGQVLPPADFSNDVQTNPETKRRGRKPGSKNKPKET